MRVEVYQFDELDPSEVHDDVLDAGIIGDSMIQIRQDEKTSTVIHGFFKFTTILTDDEVAAFKEERDRALQAFEAQELSRKFSM